VLEEYKILLIKKMTPRQQIYKPL